MIELTDNLKYEKAKNKFLYYLEKDSVITKNGLDIQKYKQYFALKVKGKVNNEVNKSNNKKTSSSSKTEKSFFINDIFKKYDGFSTDKFDEFILFFDKIKELDKEVCTSIYNIMNKIKIKTNNSTKIKIKNNSSLSSKVLAKIEGSPTNIISTKYQEVIPYTDTIYYYFLKLFYIYGWSIDTYYSQIKI